MMKSNSVDNSKMDPVHRDGDKTNIMDALANTKNDISLTDVADSAEACSNVHKIDRRDAEGDVHADRNGTDGALVDNVWLDGVKGVVGNGEGSAADDVE